MLKKLASDTAIYGLSTIAGRLINYALIPLYSFVLNEDKFGVISLFYAYAAFLNIAYTYGMETAFFRFASKNGANRKDLYQETLSSLLVTSLIFSGAMIYFAPEIGKILGHEGSEQFVRWFAYLLFIDTIVAIPFAKLRLEKQAKKFAIIKVIVITITVGLNYFLLITCGKIVSGEQFIFLQDFVSNFYEPELAENGGYAFLSNLIANSFLLILLAKELSQFRFRWKWDKLKALYKYAYPLVFSGLFFAINELIDRILLEYWLPEDLYPNQDNIGIVGIYSACYKLSIFITLATQAYKYAAEPFFFGQVENKQNKTIFAESAKYFFIATLLMFIAVSVNVDLIGSLILRKEIFRTGLGVVPFLLLANVFLGVYYNLAIWFKITDRTYFGGIIGGIGATITLVLNLVLIPYVGYYGSAITTLVCYTSMTALCYYFGKKFYPVPYDLKSAGLYLFVSIILVGLSFSHNYEDLYGKFIINNTLMLSFVGLFYWKEKKQILKILGKTNKSVQ